MAQLKEDMQQQAESEDLFEKLMEAESERQWQKRFEQWGNEELARRKLLEEVYYDRARQVAHKQSLQEDAKKEVLEDRRRLDEELDRLTKFDDVKVQAEAALQKRNQEELFRQMDFHQVQRHRELQQTMLEQRTALRAEEKFAKAMEL